MTVRQQKWFQTRMMNLANKLGFLVGVKHINMDLTKKNPTMLIYNGRNLPTRLDYENLSHLAQVGGEEIRILNKGW